jgi:hypothetical protein
MPVRHAELSQLVHHIVRVEDRMQAMLGARASVGGGSDTPLPEDDEAVRALFWRVVRGLQYTLCTCGICNSAM